MRQFYILSVAVIILLSACDANNLPNIAPSYLKINNVETVVNQESEGTSKHLISDVWIDVNSQFYGIYEVPTNIPVMQDGNNLIIIQGGILNNNQTANRIAYPFFKIDSVYTDLIVNDTVSIIPKMRYKSNLNFSLIADFDNSNDFNLVIGDGVMQTTSNVNEVFEGTKSLKIGLNTDNTQFAISTIQDFELPIGNKNIYLEMHYKNSSALNVSILAYFLDQNPQEQLILKIGAKEEWSKIYIPLTTQVSTLNAISYQIVLSGKIDDSATSATYFFDNIKLIHEPE